MDHQKFVEAVAEFRLWLNALNGSAQEGLPQLESLAAGNGSTAPADLSFHLDKIVERIGDVMATLDAVYRAAGFEPAFQVYFDSQKLTDEGKARLATLCFRRLRTRSPNCHCLSPGNLKCRAERKLCATLFA